uniref:Ribonuclease A-domain domain-containing protein n=1 Tax=Neogobius melanostomus TaxID=47308 RepID=A0A8C6UI11_9GOBI
MRDHCTRTHGLSLDPADFFRLQHTYSKDKWYGCISFMKWLMKEMKWKHKPCKAINDVILGSGKSAKTNLTAVNAVCNKGGSKTPEGYKSNTDFKVVRCRCTNPKGTFPSCKYEETPVKAYIVVKCNNGFPVNLVTVIPI